MFCENCGKSLIRGYNFCLECGTPVPPENVEPEQTADEQPMGMPEIQPASNEGGTLVFCPNCGMHMQSSTAYCEKCGQQLQSNAGGNSYSNLPKNGEVPLWNTERVDYGYETMSEGEIEQINNFMNGGGIADASDYEDYSEIGAGDTFANAIGGADGSTMPDISGSAAEIDAITAQFANMVQPSSNNEMPAIGSQDTKMQDEIIKVENFAMDSSYVDDEYVDQGALPVIEGASMEFDPDEPEPEDPNAFEMTPEAIEDITPVYEPEENTSNEEDTAPLFAAAAGVAAAEALSDAYTADETAPVYEEPTVEAPVYEEPVVEAPVYEEPAVEAPVYEEPVVEAPVYEEPVAEAPVYEEPVAEAPVYEEPVVEAPVYEEPVAEAPVYEEPVAEAPVYEEPAVEAPVYEEPVEEAYAIPLYGSDNDTASYTQQTEPEYSSDIPLFGAAEDIPTYAEPEAPVYDEPAADIPTYEETAPTYEEPVADIPAYEEPTTENTEDDSAAVAAAFAGAAVIADSLTEEDSAPVSDYSEPAPAYDEPAADLSTSAEAAPDNSYNNYDTYSSNTDASAASFAAAAAVSAAVEESEPAIDLGKLVYCRNCGQDMYEKETVCKNCGAPKRPEYQPPRTRQGKAKEPFKLFGIFSIPSIIVIAVVIIALVALLLPSLTQKDDIVDTSSKPTTSDTSGITGNEQLNAGNTSDDEDSSSVPSEPEQATTASTTAATTTTPVESTPTEIESAEPVESTAPVESEEPAVSSSSTSASTSATTPTTTPSTTTTPKPNTTTTKPVVTTTQQSGGAYTPSATIKSQNKERDKMIAAYQLMAEEMGKIDLLARSTAYAVMFDTRDADTAGKSFYNRDVAAAMLKNIKSGKSSVAAAVASAKPSTAELNTAYKALCSLEDKYNAYLDYVVNATKFGSYESKCDSYMNSFTSYAASNFSLTAMSTSAQTATDKAEYYASVVSDAVAAAENAASAYTTLRTKVSALSESNFSSQFLTVMNDNISTYLKAAKYTQAVASYCDILAAAPSAYSSAYTSIKSARDGLNNLAELFALAQYDNTLANFKSTANNYIGTASGGAAKAKNSI